LKKTAIFVDVQNIYYTCRQAFGRQFNYQTLWNQIGQHSDIILANAYAIDRHDTKQRSFQKALRNIGFNIKLKPFIQRSDGSAKGDWDVGITIDVLDAAKSVEKVILLSGDGDFDLLLQKVSNDFGIETHVFGVKQLTAQSLINSCSHYHDVDDDLLL
jgi:uncharacterized LabA/DUF88 family protein